MTTVMGLSGTIAVFLEGPKGILAVFSGLSPIENFPHPSINAAFGAVCISAMMFLIGGFLGVVFRSWYSSFLHIVKTQNPGIVHTQGRQFNLMQAFLDLDRDRG